jgi:PBSX family phage terminase large subunit
MDLTTATRLLSRKQIRSIAESQGARISIWSGAVRSGKTIASLIAFLIAVATAPDQGLILIVGRTLQTIERNVIEPLQDSALFGLVAGQISHTRGATTMVILGRTVHLIGAGDARAEGRIRGATAYLAYVDEATLIPESFWNQLLARLSVPGARLLATTNPDGPAHWLRREFLLRTAELSLGSWHFTLDDNPSLDPTFVANLKIENVGLWYRRNILGEWCLAEGAIYDMWDTERHVTTDMPPMERWISLGVDYGTKNPFAAILIGIGADRRMYAVAEYRYDSKVERGQLTDGQYSTELQAWLTRVPRPHERSGVAEQAYGVRPEHIYIDPSAASFSTQLWADQVPGVAAADNDVMSGIRTVSTLLARDRLRVHTSCRGLIGEIAGYSWDDKAAERGDDKPIKVADHSVDALRYGIHSSAWIWRPMLSQPIREVT